jgi:putative protease
MSFFHLHFIMNKIPEILAPAGNLDAAITAFENGADAVYAGLGKFNARERTENFKFNDYGKLMAYANKHGKKVYLTFNTLVKENELTEALNMLYRITRLQPDAVITQDIGVVRMMRQYFPHIPVHASTQMAIHNSAGVAMAEKMGIERVILERQVTLEEIKEIKKNSTLELEVFIHGALCCSLSGVCLFSSWMGGHSGNRGKCKQPCRRRYFSKDGNGFFFSTQDLYTLEDIPRLKEAGVASLKIEGRLRKSDYVAATVKAYRMMLDADDHEIKNKLPEAKALLSEAYGRKWSTGFYDKEQFGDLIESERLGVSGKQIGHVLSTKKSGFEMLATQPLKLGDKIRIQPKSGMEGPAVTVTKITKNGQPATRLGNKEKGFIHCNKQVPEDGMVYKTGVSVKEYTRLIEQLPVLEHNLDLDIAIDDKLMRVSIKHHPHLPVWEANTDFPAAENRAAEAEQFEKEFLKAGTDTLGIKRVAVALAGEYFVAQRDIRKFRQAFGEWLEKNYTPTPVPEIEIPIPSIATKPIIKTLALNAPKTDADHRIARYKDVKAGEEYILPLFCPETDLDDLKSKISKSYEQGVRHFRVTSLYLFDLLKGYQDIEINTGLPLPVTNRFSIETLKAWGVNRAQLWVELEKEILMRLVEQRPDDVEVYIYGRLPILETRAILPVEGAITDARGAGFTIEAGKVLTTLYPEKVFAIPEDELPPASTFTDLTHARPGEEAVSTFNYEREMA